MNSRTRAEVAAFIPREAAIDHRDEVIAIIMREAAA
jgi:hypothetical protein